jgi:hypothetical protein
MGNYSDNFDREELECPCCHILCISSELVEKLELIRAGSGIPITIANGGAYRCSTFNAAGHHSHTSSHTRGLATDIVLGRRNISISEHRYKLLYTILRRPYFQRVGIGQNFIHVDVDPLKDQTVIWDYYED